MDKNPNNNSNNNNSKKLEKNLQDLKMNISESNLELSNSIETFNNNMNKIDKYLNSKNNINTSKNSNININILENLKSSTESNIIGESSSLPIDNNRYNIKPNNKKVADPSSDLLCQKLQQKIDTLTYDNFALSKKNKDLTAKNKELEMNLSSEIHKKNTELEIINEELYNVKNK